MPNIKSAKKRVKVNTVKAMNNQMAKSALKTTLKKFDAAIAAGDKAEATVAYTTAVKAVDQAAAKHLLHKNNASNKKSKMTTKLNGMAYVLFRDVNREPRVSTCGFFVPENI